MVPPSTIQTICLVSFSVFNSDAVSGVDLYKGGFPARFTGRLSSVVDIKMREGNFRKYQAAGGLGLISSRLALEGPIVKDKASFLISARRTYFDIFTRMINRSQAGNVEFNPIPDYYFQDLNTKLTWRIGKKDKLTFTGYLGRDVFQFSRNRFSVVFDWGNSTGNLRWQREISSKLALNTNLVVTDYNYKIRNRSEGFSFQLGSGIRDFTASSDLTYTPSRRSYWQAGIRANHHVFTLGRASARSSDGAFQFNSGSSPMAQSASVFLSNETDFTEKWKLNSGLALTGFLQDGQFYGGLEPRLACGMP
jgi:outer membrane receptor for ferrienterochelin and colicin